MWSCLSTLRRSVAIVAGLCLLLLGCQRRPDLTSVSVPQPKAAFSRPVFYPSPPDPPRIQYLTSINSSWDVVPEPEKRTALAEFILGKEKEKRAAPALLRQPYGVAAWQGKIYVCDRGAGDVRVFDLRLRKSYNLNDGVGVLGQPTNMCIDSDGNKFIVESMERKIHVFGPEDDYLGTFAVKDGRPGDIAVAGDELFVTDVTGGRVLVLARSSGKVVRTIGKRGTESGQFNIPTAIASDADGNLYVCDQFNYRFQKLDRNGKALLTTGGVGDSYGQFSRPRGIAVGPGGVIYVVESVYEVVQMFSQKGEVLMGFGNFHAAPGYLELPAGIAIDKSCLPYFEKYIDPRFEAEYLIFVASQAGKSRLGVYAFGHLKPGAEIPAIPALKREPTTAPEKQAPKTPGTPPPASLPPGSATSPSSKPASGAPVAGKAATPDKSR